MTLLGKSEKDALRAVRRAWCFVGVHGGIDREAISLTLTRERCAECGRVLRIRSVYTGAVYVDAAQVADEFRVPLKIAALHFARRNPAERKQESSHV